MVWGKFENVWMNKWEEFLKVIMYEMLDNWW